MEILKREGENSIDYSLDQYNSLNVVTFFKENLQEKEVLCSVLGLIWKGSFTAFKSMKIANI